MTADPAWWDYAPVSAYSQGARLEFASEMWPQYFSAYGGEYPSRTEPQQTSGWTCPGCSRGYSPQVRQCGSCGPVAAEVTPPEQCGPGREGGMCDCDEPDD